MKHTLTEAALRRTNCTHTHCPKASSSAYFSATKQATLLSVPAFRENVVHQASAVQPLHVQLTSRDLQMGKKINNYLQQNFLDSIIHHQC